MNPTVALKKALQAFFVEHYDYGLKAEMVDQITTDLAKALSIQVQAFTGPSK